MNGDADREINQEQEGRESLIGSSKLPCPRWLDFTSVGIRCSTLEQSYPSLLVTRALTLTFICLVNFRASQNEQICKSQVSSYVYWRASHYNLIRVSPLPLPSAVDISTDMRRTTWVSGSSSVVEWN